MKTVNEISKLTGVSVRTLHHYDDIGLLKPSSVTEKGYRLYDDHALERLQLIMMFKELQFPLKEIKQIISSENLSYTQVIEDQINLLKLRRDRLDNLILAAQNLIDKGETLMDFKNFDEQQIQNYADEAKQRWGKTDAYREYEQREHKNDTAFGAEMMQIFVKFNSIMEKGPKSEEAFALVKELQNYITDHFYTCTDAIMAGLGQMYVADSRFQNNIDKAAGEGTAQFVSDAIAACFDK